ncbi:MAG: type II secretion system protein N [Pseudomonadota bacterium]
MPQFSNISMSRARALRERLPALLSPRAGLPGWVLAAPLLLVLAAQLAHWTWVFAAPEAPVSAPAGGQPAVELNTGPIVQAALFGQSAQQADAAAAAPVSLQLRGAYASSGGRPGFAILLVDGKEEAVRVGAEIVPGVVLADVQPKRVLISRGGVEEELAFEEAPSSGPGAPSAEGGQGGAGNASVTLPRALFEGAINNPSQWISAGQLAPNPGGGLKVVAVTAGGLYEKLGLQAGDVVQAVNGQNVASPEQALSMVRNAAASGVIQLSLLRGGAVQQVSYTLN